MTDGSTRRGRKDDPSLTGRLQSAMVRALAYHGYDPVRLDDLANTAGTSKQAIYRRWSGKQDFALSALQTALFQIPAPRPERTNTAQDLYRLIFGYRTTLNSDLGKALLHVRTVPIFGSLLTDFEDEVRFHIRQCLIATPFEQDLQAKTTLILGLIWQDLFDLHFGRGGLDDAELESAIYLLLGLTAPRPSAEQSPLPGL
ncbi:MULTISPECIES: TetR/AcrR family transcriptional regulator [unclassified Roseibium]|uniref:TetR/AcrR family transcriptional regulator n=1 Tax=unclassified Roseibium TaxID=2629323 RepID=UPI00273EE101|nr:MULTISPECIES: TetR/AcrR family transcriptional regulator [unclassified Roseibium]